MVDILLGITLIVLGYMIIRVYLGLKKEHKGGLSIGLIGAGVGSIMMGVGFIVRDLF
tara:strand:+ start:2028 stop:2198 length:171 start_codon:yes stop_codon:yes gene_type:complete